MHTCHATGCDKHVPPEMFMCKTHWFMLPKSMRNDIWTTYRVGQCDDMNPSKEYCEIARKCVVYLATIQGIKPDVQLYDFFLRSEDA